MRRWYLAALLVLTACRGAGEVPSSTGAGGLAILVVAPTYLAEDEAVEVAFSPVSDVEVRVAQGGLVVAGRTDAAGRWTTVAVTPTAERPVDVALTRGGWGLALFDWPETAVVLPAPGTPWTVAPAPARVTDRVAVVHASIVEWLAPSGLGERSEARVAWRHADGWALPATATPRDLYARQGIDPATGRRVCEEDPVTGEVTCYEPSSARGVSQVAFAVPTGLVELGYVERITEYATGRFVETGGLWYRSDFQVPSQPLPEQSWRAELLSTTTLCPDSRWPGAMDLHVRLSRAWVIRALGELRLGLWLRSPYGLHLPILYGEAWSPDDVYGGAGTRQVVSIPYPFSLTGPLAGFSYGYHVEATTVADGDLYRTVAHRDGGITELCRIEIAPPVVETAFSTPTTSAPLRIGAESWFRWRNELAEGWQRLGVFTATGELRYEVWIADPARRHLPWGTGLLERWTLEPGAYTLRYGVVPGRWRLRPELLLEPRLRLAERLGRYFEAVHPFRVE